MAFRKSLLGKPVQVGSKLFSTKKEKEEENKSANKDNSFSLTSEHPKKQDDERNTPGPKS